MLFKKNDEPFICENCNNAVFKLKYTSRDHCPTCLYSKHVDVYPGDRQETCCGSLVPIGIQTSKKGMQIIYKCSKCNSIKKNIIAQDDNLDLIIELSREPVKVQLN